MPPRDTVAAVLTDMRAMTVEERETKWPTFRDRLLALGQGDPERLRAILDAASSTATAPDTTAPDGTTAVTIVRSLAEIIADPAALAPPAVVAPRLAWRGRVTLLAAREKCGKSTLATAAAARVSRGATWLGDATESGAVLWVGLEEHVSDLAQRMSACVADVARVHVIDCLSTVDDPIGEIHRIASELRPNLVIVDTLAALAEATGARPDPGSSTAWTPIMSGLARIARETNAALVLLHHARKSDGKYRDSSAIGAGVDVIIEMAEGDEANLRRLQVRARWRVGDYAVRFLGERYELAAGEQSLDARVLLYVEAHEGCSQNDVVNGITGRATDTRSTIARLTESGAIENRGTEDRMRLHPGTHDGTHSSDGANAFDRTRSQSVAPSERTVRPEPKPLADGAGRTSTDPTREACDV